MPTGATEFADTQPVLAAASTDELRDREINRNDTYFAFEVTTTHATEGAPAASRAALADGPYTPVESVYIETGYGNDGQLRFSLYSTGFAGANIPDPPSLVRTIGNLVYLYDASGALSGQYVFDDFMDGAGLPGGDLASGSPAGSLYGPPGGGDHTCVGCDIAAPQLTSRTGRARIVRPRTDVLQIVTTVEPGASSAAKAADRTASDGMRTTRTFRQRTVPATEARGVAARREWILESVEHTRKVSTARGVVTTRSRSAYRYAAAHIHRGRDRARASALRDHPPVQRAASRSAADGTMLASHDGINLCQTQHNENSVRYVAAGGAPLVYQHGFCSGAGTWSAMRERVPESHRVGWEQVYSLNPDAPIESQATDLIGRLITTGVPGNVVVAHSQGGLVARRVGQRRPDLVSGVVTIATPHEGALVANNAPGVIAGRLIDAADRVCFGNLMCTLVEETVLSAGGSYLTHGTGSIIPAAGDDKVGSALLGRLNARTEPQYETFRRVSISMSVPNRWALFRLIGDGASARARLLNGQPLVGQSYARDAERVYQAGRVLEFLAMSIRWWVASDGFGWGCQQSGYDSYWEPCRESTDYAAYWRTESYWSTVADVLYLIGSLVTNSLDEIDGTWNDMTTEGRFGTDGFIQLPSQSYPSGVPGAFAPIRHTIHGEEAHSGETASREVLNILRLGLDEAGLPRN